VGALNGKSAIVTAASSGIGLAIAKRFSAEGASIVAVGRSRERLENALAGLPPNQVAVVDGDVVEEETVSRSISAARERFGGLDILVNGVGQASFADVVATSREEWDAVIRTNLTSAFLFCQAAVVAMRERGGGAIIQISSLQGVRGDYGSVAYASTKAALNNLTRAMALDHGVDGIRVNAVAPGLIETPRTVAVPDARRVAIARSTPLRRTGSPEEVASAVAFLASQDASYITGVILPVDGGRLATVGSPPPNPG
jgi:meso-butanediol dehydrogenase / (S,S)-butanediol dehydrogenase / diacetyl reductase